MWGSHKRNRRSLYKRIMQVAAENRKAGNTSGAERLERWAGVVQQREMKRLAEKARLRGPAKQVYSNADSTSSSLYTSPYSTGVYHPARPARYAMARLV